MRHDIRTDWVPVTAAVLLAAIVYLLLWPSEWGFPLDDSWIFSVFAQNLRESGEWNFNAGEKSSGITSPLWTLLLALFPASDSSPFRSEVCAARGLGLVFGLVPLVFSLSLLLEGIGSGTRCTNRIFAASLGFLIVCQGPYLFHAYSGMETLLFLSLGVSALAAYSRGYILASAVLLALLVGFRLEGVLLALVLAGDALFRRQGHHSIQLILPAMFAVGGVFLLHRLTSGSAFPKTFAGRRFLFKLDPDHIDFSLFGNHFQALLLEWIERVHDWCWMDAFLPGPQLTLAVGYRVHPFSLLLGVLTLIGAAVLVARSLELRRWKVWRPVFLLAGWTILHNLFYALVLPVGGHGGRYQAMNYLWPPILVVLAGCALLQWMGLRAPLRNRWGRIALLATAFLLLLIDSVSMATWKGVVESGIGRVNRLHLGMGTWARENLPPDARVVAFDLGGFKKASGLYVVDQSGLTDARGLESFRQHNSPEFYRDRGATHLFKFERIGEPDLAIDPVWRTTFEPLHRLEVEEADAIDREAVQNAWDRCTLYHIVLQEQQRGEPERLSP